MKNHEKLWKTIQNCIQNRHESCPTWTNTMAKGQALDPHGAQRKGLKEGAQRRGPKEGDHIHWWTINEFIDGPSMNSLMDIHQWISIDGCPTMNTDGFPVLWNPVLWKNHEKQWKTMKNFTQWSWVVTNLGGPWTEWTEVTLLWEPTGILGARAWLSLASWNIAKKTAKNWKIDFFTKTVFFSI